ncbi:MAG: MFS transporter [Verrucomicrobiae bacterium]|nr:MFS transporter [Verrucomicrobiae bacterium]
MDSGFTTDRQRRSVLIETICIPNYARLLAGQVIAAFGDRINQAALLAIVVYVTGNTAKYSADIIFFGVLPYVALGPFAVASVDRLDRRRAMIGADLARALLAGIFPLVFFGVPHPYVVYTFVFLMGACGAIFTPCRLALVPRLVPVPNLLPANAVASQAGTAATLASVPVAGWIVENFGRTSSFLINSATYLISAWFLLRILLPQRDEAAAVAPRARPLEELRLGMEYLSRYREVAASVVVYAVAQGLVGVFIPTFFSYSVDVLGQTVGGTYLLFGAIGLGSGAGAVWMGSRPQRFEGALWPLLMMGASGAGMWALSLVFNPWGAAPILGAIGCGVVMVLVPMDTFLQRRVPDQFRGRVFAVRGILWGAAFLLALQFSKAILFHLGALVTLRTLALASAAAGLIFVRLQRKRGA